MMKKTHIFFAFIIVFIIFPGFALANEEPFTAVWDTIVAETQAIESLKQPDSVKSALMIELFQRYNITEEDYRLFYDNFYNLSPEKQRQFMERVKAVLPTLFKLDEYQQAIPTEPLRIPTRKKE